MAWTRVQELQIASYTRLIVACQKTIEDVPESLRVEVQYRVDHWFETERVKLQAEATEI